jgi:hypothetical protein
LENELTAKPKNLISSKELLIQMSGKKKKTRQKTKKIPHAKPRLMALAPPPEPKPAIKPTPHPEPGPKPERTKKLAPMPHLRPRYAIKKGIHDEPGED